MSDIVCGDGKYCEAMHEAIGGADGASKTGIVQLLSHQDVVAIRCKTDKRGTFRNLILRLCPWCGEKLPQVQS